jgi:hypothetical protein
MEGFEFPADLTVDYQPPADEHGVRPAPTKIPIGEHPEIKKTPDVPTLAKRFHDQLVELGKRPARFPTANSTPQEVKEFFSKLEVPPDESYLRRSRGVPEAPDKYQWQAPEGVQVNEEWLSKGKAVAHKLGLNNDQFGELVGLHNELMQDALKVFQTKEADGIAALKAEWGADYDQNYAIAARGVQAMFKGNKEAEDKFNAFGLGNDPSVLKFFLEAGKLVAEDSASVSGATPVTGTDEARAQYNNITQPGGTQYEAFMAGDKAVLAERDRLAKILHPGDVDLSGLGGML